jgi:hypothetical protein
LELDELRGAIGVAIVRGNVAQIADGYAKLAAALVRGKRIAAAIKELEEGIDLVTAGHGRTASRDPGPADQLIAALTALGDEVGDLVVAARVDR